jgi:general secretion pathway protein H
MGLIPRYCGAFTILEVMIVIALISLLCGVLITGGLHLTRESSATPEDTFWKAVTEARRTALLSGRDVRLSFVGTPKGDKERALVIRASDGTEKRMPFEPRPGELIMEFLSAQKGGPSILLASQLVETSTMPYVTFYGDGTCSPFRVQIRAGGEPRTLMIDPWTCALVLPGTEDKK